MMPAEEVAAPAEAAVAAPVTPAEPEVIKKGKKEEVEDEDKGKDKDKDKEKDKDKKK